MCSLYHILVVGIAFHEGSKVNTAQYLQNALVTITGLLRMKSKDDTFYVFFLGLLGHRYKCGQPGTMSLLIACRGCCDSVARVSQLYQAAICMPSSGNQLL